MTMIGLNCGEKSQLQTVIGRQWNIVQGSRLKTVATPRKWENLCGAKLRRSVNFA